MSGGLPHKKLKYSKGGKNEIFIESGFVKINLLETRDSFIFM